MARIGRQGRQDVPIASGLGTPGPLGAGGGRGSGCLSPASAREVPGKSPAGREGRSLRHGHRPLGRLHMLLILPPLEPNVHRAHAKMTGDAPPSWQVGDAVRSRCTLGRARTADRGEGAPGRVPEARAPLGSGMRAYSEAMAGAGSVRRKSRPASPSATGGKGPAIRVRGPDPCRYAPRANRVTASSSSSGSGRQRRVRALRCRCDSCRPARIRSAHAGTLDAAQRHGMVPLRVEAVNVPAYQGIELLAVAAELQAAGAADRLKRHGLSFLVCPLL